LLISLHSLPVIPLPNRQQFYQHKAQLAGCTARGGGKAVFLFLQGAVIGFLLAAPVGPTGVMCIRYTLSRGMLAGFVFGLGTVLADAVYCIIAVFGVQVIADFLLGTQFYLTFMGSIALLFLGGYVFCSRVGELAARTSIKGMLGSFVTAFLLTLTNPLTIVTFAAAFAGIGVGAGTDWRESILLIGGMAWLIVSWLASSVRANFCPDNLRVVNQLSGIIIAGLGLVLLIYNFSR
jgi:threonine/homoserine/homoserine lactone efflux protein